MRAASRGDTVQRGTAGAGSVVAGLTAVWSLLAGVTGNWIAELGLPHVLNYPWVRFVVFGLAALVSVVLAVVALRGSRRDHDTEDTEDTGDTPLGGPFVAIAPADGSADRKFSIWDMHKFTPDRATVHTAIGRRDLHVTGPTDPQHSQGTAAPRLEQSGRQPDPHQMT